MDPHAHPSLSHRPPNRLADAVSPYLRQHRFNPVDWWPWGQPAFDEARRRGVPIFLSVGYSTCYWCHVMERESFEDADLAAQLNAGFLPIKLDREERPDVDDLYMAAVQAFTGHGGWPMSVFLEPDTLKPFWAGTYLPPSPRHGLPSFAQVLAGIARAWREQRGEIREQAEQLADAVRERTAAAEEPQALGVHHVAAAVQTLLKLHDRTNGGFGGGGGNAGGGPKFPQPVFLELLLDARDAVDRETATAIDAALRSTLDAMALGGIHDHVGGGFHRYSVDPRWIVPHFEKMLYDQAQLAAIYARAAAVFADPLYRRAAERTLAYVLREMTDPRGGFFTAQDAEVDHLEGLNYLWTAEQVRAALEPADAALAIDLFGLDSGPNFQDPHHPGEPPKNVLRLDERPEHSAARLGMTAHELTARLDRIGERLYAERARRPQPALDDKILCGWNGLMIGAFAGAAGALSSRQFLDAARRAADFVLTRLRADDGELRRSFRGDGAAIPAVLEDYALLAAGLTALARAERALGDAGAAERTIARAGAIIDAADQRFGDASGAVFDTAPDRPDLFVRAHSTYDGAIPSGAGVLLHALIDLHELTGDRRRLDRALALLGAVSGAIAASPVAACNSTRALLRLQRLEPGLGGHIADSARTAAETPAKFTPVEIFAPVDQVTLAPGQSAALTLRVRVAPGHHINSAVPVAAEPGDAAHAPGLVGLRAAIHGGTGVRVFADYPAGEPPEHDPALRVHHGEFDLPLVLERPAEGEPDAAWTGRPLLVVTFQACTGRACLLPSRVELDIAIDRA